MPASSIPARLFEASICFLCGKPDQSCQPMRARRACYDCQQAGNIHEVYNRISDREKELGTGYQ